MEEFTGKKYTALSKHRSRFRELIVRFFDRERSLRVLDLGCGTGEQLFDLAEVLPNSTFTGIDISEVNIKEAEDALRASPHRERMQYISGNYLDCESDLFDIIYSDSVLHLIDAPTDTLFSKIAGDLREDGMLFLSMPYACLFNRLLAGLRRVLRIFRGPLTDRLILSAGRMLHREGLPEANLRERVPYMYLIPQRYLSPAFHRLLKTRHCLNLVEELPLEHESPAQPKHRLAIYRKGTR